MKIRFLVSSEIHPSYQYIKNWGKYDQLTTKKSELEQGGILFVLAGTEILSADFRKNFDHVIIIHGSDLPRGRGWSPQVWQIIEGKNGIMVTAFEAEDKLDSGDIWMQQEVHFTGLELYDEINQKLFEAYIVIIEYIKENYEKITLRKQVGKPSYYRQRTPEDSKIDIEQSIVNQFNLLRIADPDRYPAFFEYRGVRFKIKIERYG